MADAKDPVWAAYMKNRGGSSLAIGNYQNNALETQMERRKAAKAAERQAMLSQQISGNQSTQNPFQANTPQMAGMGGLLQILEAMGGLT